MILILDNYDSFTYNLVQYVGELGAEPLVHRNDQLSVEDVESLDPAAIVISPGPGRPENAGISVPLVSALAGRTPVLGVCLGHQAIGAAFGGRIVAAGRLMHGKTSAVVHTGKGVFEGLPSPLEAMRYHSLLIDRATLPDALEITAWTADRPPEEEIMGIEHRSLPVFGVQFHPESIGTAQGRRIVENFLAIVRRGNWKGGLAEERR